MPVVTAQELVSKGRGTILLGDWYFKAYDVRVTPHSAEFHYFESYEGIIPIRRQLDKHAEVQFKVMITEQLLDSYKYKMTDPDSPFIPEPIDKSKERSKYVELRRRFLDSIDGQRFVISSDLFQPFKGVVDVKEYRIGGGETSAEYTIHVREVV